MRKWIVLLCIVSLSSCIDCNCELEEEGLFWAARWSNYSEFEFQKDNGEQVFFNLSSVEDGKREGYGYGPELSCEGSDARGKTATGEFVTLEWVNAASNQDSISLDIDCIRKIFRWKSGTYTNSFRQEYGTYSSWIQDYFAPIITEVKEIDHYMMDGVDYNACVGWFKYNIDTGDTLYQFVVSRDLGPIYLQPEGEEPLKRIFD